MTIPSAQVVGSGGLSVAPGMPMRQRGQTAGEVVPVLQERHMLGGGDSERSVRRRLAIEMCEWNGKNYCYHSRDALAKSMIENGLLEVID